MLGKKLLTLACVLAIIGIGACFLPPPHIPARLPAYLVGVRTLAIQVEDKSENEPFDAAAMSNETTASFNGLWKEYSIHARPWSSGMSADATLQIVVLHKSMLRDGLVDGKQAWNFQITAHYALTARDGSALGVSTERVIRFTRWFPAASLAPSWNLRDVFNDSAYNLAMFGGEFMFPDTSIQ